jgi:quinol-cytochrome oxidoreductase complex cytochrome b subunit
MEWLGNNWLWIVIIAGMVVMHLFGHRVHGSSHNHGAKHPNVNRSAVPGTVPDVSHSHREIADIDATDGHKTLPAEPSAKPTIKHKHGC